MKTLLHTALGENQDESVKRLVYDLCALRKRRITDYDEYTLFNFLEVVVKEDSKYLSLDHLAAPMILDQKLDTLHGLGIYSVCRELNNGDTLEPKAGMTLIKFIKKRFAVLANTSKSAALDTEDIDIRIILQRRRNAN